jgi:hypothetical protein
VHGVDSAGPIQLRIAFPPPGAFLNDPRLTVTLDGLLVYDGSFTSGFVREGAVGPGPHAIDVRLETPLFQRAKRYTFTLATPPGGYRDAPETWEVTLSYSRFWGNFSGDLPLRRR